MPPAAPARKDQLICIVGGSRDTMGQKLSISTTLATTAKQNLPRTATFGSPCAAVARCCMVFAYVKQAESDHNNDSAVRG